MKYCVYYIQLSYIPPKVIYTPVTKLSSLRSTWNVTVGPFVLEHDLRLPSFARLAGSLPFGVCAPIPSEAILSVTICNSN